MFELHYQDSRVVVHIKIDATMLWTAVQLLVLAGRYLYNVLI